MLWEEVVAEAEELGVEPDLALRERVQKAVLAHLGARKFFVEGVFQGGTALRLFYGNPRFSEDLDFVFTSKDAETYRSVGRFLEGLAGLVARNFPFVGDATVREQRESEGLKRYVFRFGVLPLGRTMRLNLEFANIPSHRHGPAIMRLPPWNPAVKVELPVEILADKIVAVAFREYVKGRDVWDIAYLSRDLNQTANVALIGRKVADYGYGLDDFRERIVAAASRIHWEGAEPLAREMTRFLPTGVASLYLPRARDMAREVGATLMSVAASVAELEA